MFNCHQIRDFKLKNYDTQTLISISGDENYYSILRDTYSKFHFSSYFEDVVRPGYWGTYIHDVTKSIQEHLPRLLKVLKDSVYIDDALEQTFALDYHWMPGGAGKEKTPISKLVSQSKPYNRPLTNQHKQNAAKLTEYYKNFIQVHPSYTRADYIISVPVKNKPFDLPAFCVQHLSQNLGIPIGQSFVIKTKSTISMKDLTSVQDKINNMRGAFSVVEDHPFEGKRVIIIDDLYDSGMTLHEIGTTLQGVGAEVVGLVATKTAWGMR